MFWHNRCIDEVVDLFEIIPTLCGHPHRAAAKHHSLRLALVGVPQAKHRVGHRSQRRRIKRNMLDHRRQSSSGHTHHVRFGALRRGCDEQRSDCGNPPRNVTHFLGPPFFPVRGTVRNKI
jgi:hypothetical protein